MVTHGYGGNRGSNGFTTGANGLGDIVPSQGLSKHNLKVLEHVLDEEDVTIYWQVVKRRLGKEALEFHPQQYVDYSLTPLTLRAKGQKRGRTRLTFNVHVVELIESSEPQPQPPILTKAQARNMALIFWHNLESQSEYSATQITADLFNVGFIPEELRKEKSHGQVEAYGQVETSTSFKKQEEA